MINPMRISVIALLSFLASFSQTGHGITITYWEEERREVQESLDLVTADYMKANPGVKVERVHFKTEDLRKQYQTATIAAAGPDLLLAPNDFAGVFAAMGTILPFDKSTDFSRFPKVLVEAISGGTGKHWGVPINFGSHLMLFANTKLMPDVPSTWEEIIKQGKLFTKPQEQQFALAFNLREPYWYVPFMGLFGGRPLPERTPNLGGKDNIKALQFVSDLKHTHKILPGSCDYSCADTLFVEGKTALTINGDWAVPKYEKALGKRLAILPLPSLAATKRHAEPMLSAKFLMVNINLVKKKKKLSAVKKFVEFMVAPATQKKLTELTRRLPALNKLLSSPQVQKDPVLKAVYAATEHGYPMPMAVEMRAVWDAIRPQLQAVLSQQTAPEKAAKRMQSDAERKLKSLR